MPRPNLRAGLDRDVYAVIIKLEQVAETSFKTVNSAYEAIKRSNSHISRQKRRPLEDSIDRVLQYRKDELQESDSEAAIEEAEAQLPKRPDEERFLLNRQLTKHWHTKPAETKASTDMAPAQDGERPKKKRRVQEDGDDKQGGSEKDQTPAPKKTPKQPRFSVETTPEALPLGGLDSLQEDLIRDLETALYQPQETAPGPSRIRGLLLTGPRGVGKRSLVRSLAGKLSIPTVSIRECFDDAERMSKSLTEAFDEALRLKGPTFILIEEIEDYMSAHGSAEYDEHHKKAVRIFLRQRDRLFQERKQYPGKHIVIIGTTATPTDLHQKLCAGEVFDWTVQIRVPDLLAREQILNLMLKGFPHDVDCEELAKLTHGFVAKDLDNLCRQAQRLRKRHSSWKRSSDEQDNKGSPDIPDFGPFESDDVPFTAGEYDLLSLDDFKAALKEYVPSLRRKGFTEIPDKSFSDIGAMVSARKQLQNSIIGPIKRPEAYAQWGLGKTAGVLLWGPPGCGKTLIAQAVANEAQASFILVNGPELLNKYVGESEKAVRELFQRARSSTPCVLFFDEMDSVVPKRGSSSNDAGVRVVNALLTEMDGVKDPRGVFIIGTTNRPDMIDPAMLRPGRMSVKVFVDLPTEDERVDILQTIFRNLHSQASNSAKQSVEAVARDKRCRGFSGADLSGLRETAANIAMERWLSNEEKEPAEIIAHDWELALQKTKPSVGNAAEYHYIKKRLEQE